MPDPNEFLASLGEHSTHELFAGVEDVKGLASKAIELNASMEELRSAQPKIPDSVDGYKFELPQDAKVSEESLASFKQKAFDLKIPNNIAHELIKFDLERVAQAEKAIEAKQAEAVAEMKKEMGDKYDTNLALAQKVIKAFGGEEVMNDVDLGNRPDLFKLLVNIGGAISEDKLENPAGGGGSEGKKSLGELLYNKTPK